MPIYRVAGIDRYTQRDRTAYIQTLDTQSATDIALNRGIAGPQCAEVQQEDVPDDVPVIGQRRRPGPPRGRELLNRPVWTIARGVFLGLLLWTGFLLALWLVGLGIASALG